MELKSKLAVLVYGLKNRPAMFLSKPQGFLSYRYFLEGYFYGVDISNNTNLAQELSGFISRNENSIGSSNVPWTIQFENKYSGKNDDQKISILIEVLEKFFHEKYFDFHELVSDGY